MTIYTKEGYFEFFKQLVLLISILIITGCAKVPIEVVELSYTIGHDLNTIHASYRGLVSEHFNNLRFQVTNFIETRWMPVFIEDFIKRSELIQTIVNNPPDMVLEDLTIWAETAIEIIESKKREMISQLDEEEKLLLILVDDQFDKLLMANAAITAHLNTLRKIDEFQSKALSTIKLDNLRDQINLRLFESTKKINDMLNVIEKSEIPSMRRRIKK